LQTTPPSSPDDPNNSPFHSHFPQIFYGIFGLLGLHVLVWIVAHGVANTNLDGYADMLENYARRFLPGSPVFGF
jgi:putative NADPH-quinone reductase